MGFFFLLFYMTNHYYSYYKSVVARDVPVETVMIIIYIFSWLLLNCFSKKKKNIPCEGTFSNQQLFYI